ncbi:Bax inhibitor-1 family protein [Limosilactobacillus albertensis]|uniref:Bax inhibitor-1/YccA family protein n=1 Tax=Limosilactobacillus albertensis TaxID=2759752 RepID=A0A839HB28_9LACO|nr:Bax inhibitor-1/YccA family protein [Limosilactobacillus albertensis]MBB1124357.1 Bax inhibitor-1/YccA family protein [Limosilactobacillus albertensis]MCD7122236.1 Bax inhibitor-1/YccA family protein [Limosilactobacillus albertensis]
MDDFSPNRRNVADVTGLNRFLTKMYGLMTLAVLLSALTAWLVMNVFAKQFTAFMVNNRWGIWLIILLPIILTFGISFNATRSPGLCFFLLVLTAIIYGISFAFIAGAYAGTDIATAFVSSAGVFLTMAIIGTFSHRDFTRMGSYASAALIGLIIALLVNFFVQSPMISYILSIIAVIIFTALTAWDAQRMKNIYLECGDQVSSNGLAVLGALQLYLDFINLFVSFLDIFGSDSER